MIKKYKKHQGWICDRCGKKVKPNQVLYDLIAVRGYGLVCFYCGNNYERKQAHMLNKDLGGASVKRISEVTRDNGIEVDEFVRLDDLLDKDLELEEIIERKGQYGAYMTVKAKLDGKSVGFNTGSSPLLKKLKQVKDKEELPIIARIRKVRSVIGQFYYVAE